MVNHHINTPPIMSGVPLPPRDAWRQHHNLPPGTSSGRDGGGPSPAGGIGVGAGGGIGGLHSLGDHPSLDDSGSSYDDASSLYSDEGDSLPYPGFLAITFGCLHQEAAPRAQCLALVTNPYPLQAINLLTNS